MGAKLILALLLEVLSLVDAVVLWQGSYQEIKLYGDGFAVECLARNPGAFRCAVSADDDRAREVAESVRDRLLTALGSGADLQLERRTQWQSLRLAAPDGEVRCEFPNDWAYRFAPPGSCRAVTVNEGADQVAGSTGNGAPDAIPVSSAPAEASLPDAVLSATSLEIRRW